LRIKLNRAVNKDKVDKPPDLVIMPNKKPNK